MDPSYFVAPCVLRSRFNLDKYAKKGEGGRPSFFRSPRSRVVAATFALLGVGCCACTHTRRRRRRSLLHTYCSFIPALGGVPMYYYFEVCWNAQRFIIGPFKKKTLLQIWLLLHVIHSLAMTHFSQLIRISLNTRFQTQFCGSPATTMNALGGDP